jgi:hypothetical protein
MNDTTDAADHDRTTFTAEETRLLRRIVHGWVALEYVGPPYPEDVQSLLDALGSPAEDEAETGTALSAEASRPVQLDNMPAVPEGETAGHEGLATSADTDP